MKGVETENEHCKNELVKVTTCTVADGSDVHYKLQQESLPRSDLHYSISTVKCHSKYAISSHRASHWASHGSSGSVK